MKTRIIQKKDFQSISRIWKDSLNYDIYALLGNKIIIKYLNIYFKNKKNLGFVIERKKNIHGFVLYGNDSKIRNLIKKKYFILIIKKFIYYLISLNLKKILIFIDIIIFISISKNLDKQYRYSTELLCIAIDNKIQNKGLGKKLVKQSLLNNKYFSNFKNITVRTLNSTPKNIKFYNNLGFKTFKIFYGRTFLKKNL